MYPWDKCAKEQERGRTLDSDKNVAKVCIFTEKLWLNLVEITLKNDTDVAFTFYNARVVKSSNLKKIYIISGWHFWAQIVFITAKTCFFNLSI